MHEEEDLRWINVSDQKQGRDNSSRGRYRGEERPSNYRGSYTERARPGFQEDRSLITSSRGVRRERERSPREFFHYRERSYVRRSELNRNGSEQNAGQSRVQEHGGNVVNMEGCGDDASQKEEKEELLPVEDSLDLANEVLEAMNITEGDKGMEVDAKNGSTDTAVMLKDADEEFQDLTDEESGFKGDTRLVSDVVGEILEKEASKEEGEVEKDFTEEEVGKKQGAKKKTFKAGIAGASIAKKRLVNAMIQGKRTTSKSSSRQEEGGKKMEEKSSFNSMPSTTKGLEFELPSLGEYNEEADLPFRQRGTKEDHRKAEDERAPDLSVLSLLSSTSPDTSPWILPGKRRLPRNCRERGRETVPEETVVIQLSDETGSSREAKKKRTDESPPLEPEENIPASSGQETNVGNADPPPAEGPPKESGARDSVPEDAIPEEPAPVPIGEESNVMVSSDSSSSQQVSEVEEPGERKGGSPRRGVSEEPPKDSEDVVANPSDTIEEAARTDGTCEDAS
ncbi:hypothetical protein Bca52824_026838 [Brassica carinata]|uniref:Uncharacterized protein n=1 Tax=Brassica carinata TaxID=52824 RepID=A0A8X7SK63_BRACI|nr:hypothetical protein Bca52824_026838 [Brassica carinata]